MSHSRLLEVLGISLRAREACQCPNSPISNVLKPASSSGMTNAGDKDEGRDADDDDDENDHPLVIARRVLSEAVSEDGGRNSPSTLTSDRFSRFAIPPSQSANVGIGHSSTIFPSRLPMQAIATPQANPALANEVNKSPASANSAHLLPLVSPRIFGATPDLQPAVRMPSLPTYPLATLGRAGSSTSPRSFPFLTNRTGGMASKGEDLLNSVETAPNSARGTLLYSDLPLPPGAVDSVPEGTVSKLVYVPLRLLCFYQDYVCNRFIDGRSLKDTIAELREGIASHDLSENRQKAITLPPSLDIVTPSSLPFLSVFTPVGSSSSNPQVVKPQTPDTLPVMDAMYWRGRWFGMGNRRLTCFHYVFAKAPNTLIPVMATHVKDTDNLMPQGSGYAVKIGGGLFIDGLCLLTLSHCCRPTAQ